MRPSKLALAPQSAKAMNSKGPFCFTLRREVRWGSYPTLIHCTPCHHASLPVCPASPPSCACSGVAVMVRTRWDCTRETPCLDPADTDVMMTMNAQVSMQAQAVAPHRKLDLPRGASGASLTAAAGSSLPRACLRAPSTPVAWGMLKLPDPRRAPA